MKNKALDVVGTDRSAHVRPEIYIGLVARLGIDTDQFKSVLSKVLSRYGYKTEQIKISDIVSQLFSITYKKHEPEKRISGLIDNCNRLRRETSKFDILTYVAVKEIREIRTKLSGGQSIPAPEVAYIISQFKKPEEIETFRAIYGRQALIISLHDNRAARIRKLARLIHKSKPGGKSVDEYMPLATQLINRDEEEEENKYGQNVRNAFPLADVVIDSSQQIDYIEIELIRVFDYFFGSPKSAPRLIEIGMNAAFVASLSSTDLSRQVGAAIVDEDGSVVVTGCNDAPKYGGGTYLEDDHKRHRDIDIGNDANEEQKAILIKDFLECLRRDNFVDENALPFPIGEAYNYIKSNKGNNLHVSKSKIFDLLEFSRSVHAEMSVISTAARKGISLVGKTLYCTTFPCHSCAKHIVASGIIRVVYLEPYPKSLVSDLHPDSIYVVDEPVAAHDQESRVRFEQFLGVAPARYGYLYARKRRKSSTGEIILWEAGKDASPVRGIFIEGYLERELKAELLVTQLLSALQLDDDPNAA
ncbi:MAG: hypothetical protein GC187_07650 [Alphaproteobacteria bacterium]|nr:hypothetical protein [Alphaproteobacteria bacterium]